MAAAQGDILSESLGGLALLTVTGDAPGCLESLVVEACKAQTPASRGKGLAATRRGAIASVGGRRGGGGAGPPTRA
ncbi:unnamed protein product, partial [Ectocarpus sp. 12 AP-2014]